NIGKCTLLLSPEMFDFSKEITIYINGKISYQGFFENDKTTLLKWYKNDLDRTMIFGAELTLKI
ncbi:MAG: hypothetical protein C0597_00935, partial [Marinilabiliales bacterium]